MTAAWFSQPTPAMGATNGEGIRKALGLPAFDPLTILLREAAQNSWDAGIDKGNVPVRFALDLVRPSGDRRNAWHKVLSAGVPAPAHLPLATQLEAENLDILIISDRGTRGLGGPTRDDEAADAENRDYASFVLTVGEPRDQHLGGGTYGFGKAVFFDTSRAYTAFVHTRCRTTEGEHETRLIGIAIGGSYVDEGRKHTGRHWWGEQGEEATEPLRGAAAEHLAEQLGFPSFAADETGTSIAIVAPHFGERSREDGMAWIASAITWHLWPKMRPSPRAADVPMTFSVSCDGAVVPILPPAEHPVLKEFVRALDELDRGDPITFRRREIGRVRLTTTFAGVPEVDEVGAELGFAGGVHHTCLLRGPRLVVNYEAGRPGPDARVWYAGVFVADDAHDETFTAAEPPTHDAWTLTKLERSDRGIVNKALTSVRAAMNEFATPTPASGEGEQDVGGLAAVSRSLGTLLAPAPGSGAGPRHGEAPGPRGPAPITMVGRPVWTTENDRNVLVQRFRTPTSREVTVRGASRIVVWGGGRAETDAGDQEPKTLGWRRPGGELMLGDEITIPAAQGGEWEIVVAPVPDTATDIHVVPSTRSAIVA
jgi:hypothetical protein